MGDKTINTSDPVLKRALFAEMLQELTFNSKEIINKITVFAGENKDIAPDVHELLTGKIREVNISFQFIRIKESFHLLDVFLSHFLILFLFFYFTGSIVS